MAERLVVIGADAAGMSAASQARRRRTDLEIVALERGNWTSYSACGIPYYVGGEVSSIDDLIARTPQRFRDELLIDVRLQHEVMGIDLDQRQLEVRDHGHGRTYTLPFDELMVATGSRPLRPDLPGADLEMIHGVQTLDDAQRLLSYAEEHHCENVVVVGGGYIGLEMAEALALWGADVTIVEARDEVMPTIDPEMAQLVTQALRRHEIDVITGAAATAFEPGRVLTEATELDADLVVLGIGVQPNSEVAADAGIEVGVKGAIRTNSRQQTSAAGVWAAGDCCESRHLVTGDPAYVALGTVANRQGRVAGINIGGGYATFPGVAGTAVTRVCSTEIGRTGLSEREAATAGLEYVTASIESTSRSGYLPQARPMRVKMLAERGHGRVLGAQVVGEDLSAKRIDVVATAIAARMTVFEMIDLDLAYAPPFSPLWDPVVVAARRAAAVLEGRTA